MSLIFESFVKILYKPGTSANLVCSPPPPPVSHETSNDYEMRPMVTQDFTAPTLATLT